MNVLLSWLVLAVGVWLASTLLPGVKLRGRLDAVVVAAIFGLLNWAIGWLLFGLIGVATLGLGFLLAFVTRWVVDTLILLLTDALTDRLKVQGLKWAAAAALIMSAVGTIGEWVLGR